jgi:hypothetical protein
VVFVAIDAICCALRESGCVLVAALDLFSPSVRNTDPSPKTAAAIPIWPAVRQPLRCLGVYGLGSNGTYADSPVNGTYAGVPKKGT